MRKWKVIALLTGIVLILTAAVRPEGERFKNLQVFPPDTGSKLLMTVMVDQFQDDLGVSCSFCHVEDPVTHKPDYVSDDKPEKKISRSMMRMTIKLNRKNFGLKHFMIGDPAYTVSCVTCHEGKARPVSR